MDDKIQQAGLTNEWREFPDPYEGYIEIAKIVGLSSYDKARKHQLCKLN